MTSNLKNTLKLPTTRKLTNLKEIGSKYDAAGYYIVDKISGLPQIPALRLIQNDKEDFGNSNPKADDMTTYGYYTNAIYNSNYTFTDQQLLRRYLLTTDASRLNGIPVIVSAQEAVSLFGKKLNLEAEPADTNQKSTWLKNVQEKLNGYTYQVCYRNSAEQTLLKKIQQNYIEAKANEANKNYQKPSMITRSKPAAISQSNPTRGPPPKRRATILTKPIRKNLGHI